MCNSRSKIRSIFNERIPMKPFPHFLTGSLFCICCICLLSVISNAMADPIIIDHAHTDIFRVSQADIEEAKLTLHIAYGHTSHGSQLTTGMNGLVDFANNGGLGISLPHDIFAWNNGGTDGALDLDDYAMSEDVGYYPQWVNSTRSYLDNPGNGDVNVIIWSWCGQVEDKYRAGTLESEYLAPMAQVEADYPNVMFVYMTGHVDVWDDAANKAANQMIRNFCVDNNKILYDFADIEHYDLDGTYFQYVHDSCDYYDGPDGTHLGNWAAEWQDSHTRGVDWYDCQSAHSQPLNANQKAYAAWSLWAALGGMASSTSSAVDIEIDGSSDGSSSDGSSDGSSSDGSSSDGSSSDGSSSDGSSSDGSSSSGSSSSGGCFVDSLGSK